MGPSSPTLRPTPSDTTPGNNATPATPHPQPVTPPGNTHRGAMGGTWHQHTGTRCGAQAEPLPGKHFFKSQLIPQTWDGPKVCLRRRLSRPVPHTQLGINFLFTYFFQLEWLLTPP